jgi:hypothetical protein
MISDNPVLFDHSKVQKIHGVFGRCTTKTVNVFARTVANKQRLTVRRDTNCI